MSKYVCKICGYVYDEADNPPFDTLPDDWQCPLCGAPKSQFEKEGGDEAPVSEDQPDMPEIKASEAADISRTETSDSLRGLSYGELAALCSNLSRGCEKQYKSEEAALFAQIAEYYGTHAGTGTEASFDTLAEASAADLVEFKTANSVVDAAGDRGAKRVLVWTEKVTKILNSVLGRYRKEGASVLDGTKIWVCDICGFVYIGDEPPAVCPICKVPGFKILEVK